MKKSNEESIMDIIKKLREIDYISPSDIPNIDLYMDQVTTFMDSHLHSTARNPGEDKILTKTMINNYTKNDLLPPPMKKKYSKEHVLLLVFIYYYKGILSINDIQTLFGPLTSRFFHNGKEFNLESIYKEAFGMANEQMEALKEDVREKYRAAQETFSSAPQEDADFLRKFAFICTLSFDVYLKKLMIEKMIDELAAPGRREEKKEAGEK